MNRNQHYRFWVSYYDKLERLCELREIVESKHTSQDQKKTAKEEAQRIITEKNRDLVGCRWMRGESPIPVEGVANSVLYFKAQYPGILIGLGNSHDSGQADGELQLGFTFDPVTGLPFLPGSSVKGILRSAFLANREYVQECLQDCGANWNLSDTQIQELERDIFGNDHPYGSYSEKQQTVGAGKDTFFDAYPVKADSKDHLLGLENITPHLAKKKELEGLTSPTPLSLLKIMPGVVLQFRFRLVSSVLSDGTEVTPEDKRKVFQTILQDFGVGAKTNVGFGSLEALNAAEIKEPCHYLVQQPEAPSAGNHPEQRPERRQNDANRSQPSRSAGSNAGNAPVQRVTQERDIQKGMILQGEVNGFDSYGNFYVTLIPGTRVSGKLDSRWLKRKLTVGETVTVRVFDIRDGWDKRLNQPRKNYVLNLI